MTPSELGALLTECYRERLALYERHKAVARHVADYDVNNAYQYIVNREETQLQWIADALTNLGVPIPDASAVPAVTVSKAKDAWRALCAEDARAGQAFLEKWGSRVDLLTQARDRTLLKLMLGEVKEQTRTFEQAAAGVDNLLGRKDVGSGKRGVVAAVRWFGD